MTRREHDELDPIEASGASPMARARMWQRMQEELARRDAEDAAAAAIGTGSIPPRAGAIDPTAAGEQTEASAAAAGALGAGLQAAVRPSPLDERLGRLAAIQADALARLEEQTHADQVLAGIRDAQPQEGNAVIARQDELAVRKHERDLTERALQKRADTLGYAEDHVARTEAPTYRDGRERLEDERDRRERRLD